jgi:hypothetical protein
MGVYYNENSQQHEILMLQKIIIIGELEPENVKIIPQIKERISAVISL